MTSNLSDSTSTQALGSPILATPSSFNLDAFCYEDRIETLPEITSAFATAGGWVTEKRTVSATAMEYRFEIHLSGIVELYGSLVGLGLELTRGAHALLTELCTCSTYQEYSTDMFQVVCLKLSVSFLADVTLHSILMTGSGQA